MLGDFFKCQGSLQESLFYEDKNLLEVHHGEVRKKQLFLPRFINCFVCKIIVLLHSK